MQTCQRCDRAFTVSEDFRVILRDWYKHLLAEHDNDIGSEYLARVEGDTGGEPIAPGYAPDFDSIAKLLADDLPRARKLWS